MQPEPPPFPAAPPPPGPLIGYATPVAPLRPTAVSVLAIIGIVYASVGLLNALAGLVGQLIVALSLSVSTGLPNVIIACSILIASGNLVLASLLLTASIGSLRMRAWGRDWMVRWACAYLAWLVVEAAVQLLVVLPETMNMITSAPNPGGTTPPPAVPNFMRAAMYGGVLVTLAFCVILPTFVLVYMRKPTVRAAFDRAGMQNAAPSTEGYQS